MLLQEHGFGKKGLVTAPANVLGRSQKFHPGDLLLEESCESGCDAPPPSSSSLSLQTVVCLRCFLAAGVIVDVLDADAEPGAFLSEATDAGGVFFFLEAGVVDAAAARASTAAATAAAASWRAVCLVMMALCRGYVVWC